MYHQKVDCLLYYIHLFSNSYILLDMLKYNQTWGGLFLTTFSETKQRWKGLMITHLYSISLFVSLTDYV